jgi:indole-3-acetate monooxygenase
MPLVEKAPSAGSTQPDGADALAIATKLAGKLRDVDATLPGSSMLPPAVVSMLEDAGMFRLGLSRTLGGSEVDPVTLLRIAENLAYADGSVAWTTMTGNSSMFTAWMDHEAASRLLEGKAGLPVSGAFTPGGLGVEESGGYRITGRWSYVSGSPQASMVLVSFVVADPGGSPRSLDGQPVTRWAFIPAADIQVQATWDGAVGLRGSGSDDIRVDAVFVPAEHTVMPAFEAPRVAGALYRVPFFALVRCSLTGVPLGVGRRALDEVTELVRHKQREMMPLVEDQDTQIRLAKAQAGLRAGRAYVLETADKLWATVRSGGEATFAQRAELALACQFAVTSAVDAVDVAFKIAGVSAALPGNVIQRCWVDVNVASQHIAFSRPRWRDTGQALLGTAEPVTL